MGKHLNKDELQNIRQDLNKFFSKYNDDLVGKEFLSLLIEENIISKHIYYNVKFMDNRDIIVNLKLLKDELIKRKVFRRRRTV